MYRVLIFVSILGGVFGQLVSNNTCGDITGILMDPDKFVGKWNQIERIDNEDEKGDCSSVEIKETNGTYTMTNREVVSKKEQVRSGNIVSTLADIREGKLVVDFSDNKTMEYYILSANSTYVLLYSCIYDAAAKTSKVYAWKYSSTTEMSAADGKSINDTLTSHNLEISDWRQVSQRDGACDVNKGIGIAASPVLALLAFFLISKDIL